MWKSSTVTFKFKAKNEFFTKFEYQISIWLIFDIKYQISIWWIFDIQYQSGGYSIFKCENLVQ